MDARGEQNQKSLRSTALGHSMTLEEKYDEIKFVLEKISYRQHQWIICVDLKMVGFLLRLQGGYIKFPCFLCLRDSRARTEHWIKKDWPVCSELIPGSSFGGAFQNCVSSSSHKVWHYETVCEGS